MKAWQRRYLVWVVSWCDSWGVSTQVEAGKPRENCGWCKIFCMDFLCVFSLSSGSSSVVRAHNLLRRGILRRREAEELVCVLCEASTTCRDGVGGVVYQTMSRGAMVKHRTS